eukprot:TRINITY_DN3192_c0_g5_i1.p1 TRINITY_DN3192_c0_g5~~TRINITY_DN3192_c0_g5_i1.p1  ORF type:complete len:389 (+),score=126.36 TRINITY_DN3192_c0_g5_i1:682-1848(+)
MSGYNSIFSLPSTLFIGEGKTADLIGKMAADGFKKALLHFGGGSIKRNGVYDEVVALLKEHNIDFVEAGGQKPNPELAIVREGISIFKRENCDVILAVGGGSVIDSAKGISVGCANPEDVWYYYSTMTPITNAIPIYCVLTLSATGSESNFGSVVSSSDENQKYGYLHPLLLPKASCIDPKHQMSLPWYQTVNGAIDACSHLFEQYLGIVRSGCRTPAYAIEGVIQAVADATNRIQVEDTVLARGDLSFAANLALNNIFAVGTDNGDWATHMIAHMLAACWDKSRLSHGACLGVLTGEIFLRLKEKSDEFAELLNRLAHTAFHADSIEEAVEIWKKQVVDWGHPITITELIGETPTEEYLAKVANHTFKRGLRHFSEAEILDILKACV